LPVRRSPAKISALLQFGLSNDIPELSDKTGDEVAQHLERAIQDVANATEEIQAAIVLEDAP